MKNIYEPMDDFGGKVYDFDIEFTDCWNTGLDDLDSRGGFATEFGRCSETLITGINSIPSAAWQFSSSVVNSTEIEVGVGFGIGVEGNLGGLDASLLAAPLRDEYIFNTVDCKKNTTGVYSAGVTVFDSYGLEAQFKKTAYNDSIHNAYNAADSHWENDITIGNSNSNSSYSTNNSDFTLNFGGSLYILLGADVNLSFNCSNFFREIGIFEDE